MKLFVGLGNPGGKYSGNRHNVGFMAVDRIAAANGFSNWRKRFQGESCEGILDGEKVVLLKPATYMNDSGKAVGAAVRFLKIDLADVVVFYDEIDLAPAKLKVKTGGGNAGHNGLRSITHLVGNDYVRVRIGVGHPGHRELVAGYVLHDFARADREWLDPMLEAICDASGHLAADNAARFLSDVALKLNPGETQKEKPKKNSGKNSLNRTKRAAAAGSDTIDAAPAPTARPLDSRELESPDRQTVSKKIVHPAGERQSKRQNALAENLKKWMKRREKD